MKDRESCEWWNGLAGPEIVAENLEALRPVFSAEWLMDEVSRERRGDEPSSHPFRFALSTATTARPSARDVNALGALVRRFEGATGFSKVMKSLRTRQDFAHARCCLESADVLASGPAVRVTFEYLRPGRRDGHHDLLIEDGEPVGQVFVEVKVGHVSQFVEGCWDLGARITQRYPTSPELRGCNIDFHQAALSAVSSGRLTKDDLIDEAARIARRVRIARTFSSPRVAVSRKSYSGGGGVGGPLRTQSRRTRRSTITTTTTLAASPRFASWRIGAGPEMGSGSIRLLTRTGITAMTTAITSLVAQTGTSRVSGTRVPRG